MDLQLLTQALKVPAKQEQSAPVTGDSQALQVALNNDRIIKRAIEDLKGVLRLVMIKIGLRSQNWPSDIERGVLIEHILTHYANHTCEEIKLAFEMAMSGKLGVGANCYENFSCLYFSGVMNAYRKWAEQEAEFLRRTTEVPPEQKIYSDEEILNQRRAEIETAFQAMKNGRYPLLHVYFEEVLKGDELMNEGETLGEFFVRKIGSGCKNIYVQ